MEAEIFSLLAEPPSSIQTLFSVAAVALHGIEKVER